MSWILMEGIDRSGKSSVAEMYKKDGYEVVHMSAPKKDYSQPGYAGPSYLDELIDLYMKYSGRDVVFDRSPYGELVWPIVYGRKPLLSEDDLEILIEIEDSNEAQRIYMKDENVAAHWQRCVDNKEPLNKSQFSQAGILYDRLAKKFNFTQKSLKDFNPNINNSVAPAQPEEELKNVVTVNNGSGELIINNNEQDKKTAEQSKLDKANVINDILSKRLLKSKGPIYDELEKDIRNFLNDKLKSIFGSSGVDLSGKFTPQELEILKMLCKRTLQKVGK